MTPMFDELVALLEAEAARFRVSEHSADGGSDLVAAIRGTEPGQGAKAMLCKCKETRAARWSSRFFRATENWTSSGQRRQRSSENFGGKARGRNWAGARHRLVSKKHPNLEDTPSRREHISRLGDYPPDLQRPVPPLDPTIDFLRRPAT
jgi:hypothetical protein